MELLKKLEQMLKNVFVDIRTPVAIGSYCNIIGVW